MALALVHHPDYAADLRGGADPAQSKHRLVLAALEALGVVHTPLVPAPMPLPWLETTHDAGYVAAVLAANVAPPIERRIGFPVTPGVARRAVLVAGGTWLAARRAWAMGFAANLAGGSHHAMRDTGAGYCVLNDLAIAARRLLGERRVARLLVVDLDVHQGDGTAALLADTPGATTFSVHAEKNFPTRKAASTRDVALPDGMGDEAYLAVLEAELPALLDRHRPELVLYQAGVDVHVDDKLGRLALTDAGIEARDFYVVDECRRRGIGVAATLGGGYGADRAAVARRHALGLAAMGRAADGFQLRPVATGE